MLPSPCRPEKAAGFPGVCGRRSMKKECKVLTMKKQLLSVLTTGALTATLATSALAAEDLNGHWAEDAMNTWMDQGIILGYGDGTARPDNSITRAELAVILDRVMEYRTQAENGFSDLGSTWYTEAILNAAAAGVLRGYGNGTVRPAAPITRAEAAVMFARVLDLDGYKAPEASFTDQDRIPAWAANEVNAMAEKGYMQGSGGAFRPNDSITRAEVVTILDNIFATLYREGGEYTGNVDGSAVVSADQVTLKDMTVAGDLIVAEGVGEGHIVLDSVTVAGKLIVRGGGENSVIIKGSSNVSAVVVERRDGQVRLSVEDDADVRSVLVDEGADTVKIHGAVEAVAVAGAGAQVQIAGAVGAVTVHESASDAVLSVHKTASVGTVTTGAANVTLSVSGTVEKVSVSEGASGTAIQTESGAKIDSVTTAGSGTTVSGGGTVSKVEATQSASGTTVSTGGTHVENNSGESVTIPGGGVVSGGSGTTTPGSGDSSGGSGGGGGSEDTAPDSGKLMSAIQSALTYAYDDYTYTGAYTSAADGDTVTVDGAYSLSALSDGSAMNDMARLLGALHRHDSGESVKSITYGGTVYTWAKGENAVNAGSNWVKNPDETAGKGNTLVSRIVEDYNAADGAFFPLELTLTGADGSRAVLQLNVTALAGSEAELKAALAANLVGSIRLSADFTAESRITVERPVSIDGNGKTITASSGWTDGSGKHLLVLESGADHVTIKDLTLDSANHAYGMQAYNAEGVRLEDVTLTGSKGSGLTVNGSELTAKNLSVSNSAWGQSIDVSRGDGVKQAAVLTLTGAALGDKLAIIEDVASAETPAAATVTVDGKQWGSYLYTYESGGTRYKHIYTEGAALMAAVHGAVGYEYTPEYAYSADFTAALTEGGMTLSASYSPAHMGDGTAMKDMAACWARCTGMTGAKP